MIFDHVGMVVSDYEKSKTFYTHILAPLNITPVIEHKEWIGFGKQDKPEFWLGLGKDPKHFLHIAFAAETKEDIDVFYNIALENGAICNGKPGLRKDYYPEYYGAFIIDYDGHHIAAVIHSVGELECTSRYRKK